MDNLLASGTGVVGSVGHPPHHDLQHPLLASVRSLPARICQVTFHVFQLRWGLVATSLLRLQAWFLQTRPPLLHMRPRSPVVPLFPLPPRLSQDPGSLLLLCAGVVTSLWRLSARLCQDWHSLFPLLLAEHFSSLWRVSTRICQDWHPLFQVLSGACDASVRGVPSWLLQNRLPVLSMLFASLLPHLRSVPSWPLENRNAVLPMFRATLVSHMRCLPPSSQ